MLQFIADVMAATGTFGIFLLMLAENIFPPIPSEAIMPVAGFAAAQGKMDPLAVFLAGSAGAILGNACWFEAARAVGQERIERLADKVGKYFGITGEDVRDASAVLIRWGIPAVFFCRFLPGPRTLISVPAGIVRMNRWVFYIFTSIGTMGWTAFLMAAGWWLEGRWEQIDHWMEPLGIAVVAAVLLLYVWHLWRTRHRWRRGGASG
ncbi:DedA family protein [Roseomonas sp. SSH11]|uniref:DedA family protein n=1 Tax=Pararoseomonas baculiformis TaxID=2820812 RepID=A0ABS4AC36_9PROT|nr:DedA family protein [Pararoseomonas baculiformis]MBP0444572.1 DedA family protein [Pararoseomonas baculiformis]